MFRRRKSTPRTEACPNCDAPVRVGALACPSCGSDADTGWSDDADDIWYEDVGGYDDAEDGSPELERGQALHPGVVVLLIVIAVVVLVLR